MPIGAGFVAGLMATVIFAGVFCVQSGVGLLEDGLQRVGLAEADGFRAAMGLVGLGVVAAFL